MSEGRKELKVKWYSSEKGYGFLCGENGGSDIFFHARQLKESGVVGDIEPGQKFSFEIETGKKGAYAKNLKRVS